MIIKYINQNTIHENLILNSGTYDVQNNGILFHEGCVFATKENYYFPSKFSIRIIIENLKIHPDDNNEYSNGFILGTGTGQAFTPATYFGIHSKTRQFKFVSNNVPILLNIPDNIDLTKEIDIFITYNEGLINVYINQKNIGVINKVLTNYNTPLYIGGFPGYVYQASGSSWGGTSGLYKCVYISDEILEVPKNKNEKMIQLIKNIILNNKLFQEHCVPYEEE